MSSITYTPLEEPKTLNEALPEPTGDPVYEGCASYDAPLSHAEFEAPDGWESGCITIYLGRWHIVLTEPEFARILMLTSKPSNNDWFHAVEFALQRGPFDQKVLKAVMRSVRTVVEELVNQAHL